MLRCGLLLSALCLAVALYVLLFKHNTDLHQDTGQRLIEYWRSGSNDVENGIVVECMINGSETQVEVKVVNKIAASTYEYRSTMSYRDVENMLRMQSHIDPLTPPDKVIVSSLANVELLLVDDGKRLMFYVLKSEEDKKTTPRRIIEELEQQMKQVPLELVATNSLRGRRRFESTVKIFKKVNALAIEPRTQGGP